MSLYDEGKALIYDYEYFNRDMELTNEFNDRVEKGEYISEEEQSVYNYATDRVMQYNVLLGKSNTNVWERYAEKNQQYNDFKGGYSQQPTDEIDSVDAVTGRIPEMNNGQNVASGNGVSAPSGEESYYRQAQELQKEHPEWSLEQITNKMSEIVWNNNYKALMDDIAHSSSPEEREQKIRDHQWELGNYKASGINVDNDEKYLRDTQGMPSESIFNKIASVMSNYSFDSVEYQDSVSPDSLAFVEIPKDGISLEKYTDYQIQKKDDENTVYDAYAQQSKEFFEKVQKIPGWDSAMGYLHGLVGADGSYENRSGDYKFTWNLSNNAVSKLISAAAKVAETAPPTFPGRGPMLSSELVTGGAVARSTVTNFPSNIYFSSSKGNESSTSNSKESGEADYASTYKKRLDQTPTNSADGEWVGFRGESTYVSNNPKVKALLNKDGVIGIKYNNGIPDFSPVSKGQVEIEGMTANRAKNFDKADAALAQERGVTTKEIKQWRVENNLTWHECNDMRTMQAVPSEINGAFGHLGGVGEINAAAK